MCDVRDCVLMYVSVCKGRLTEQLASLMSVFEQPESVELHV